MADRVVVRPDPAAEGAPRKEEIEERERGEKEPLLLPHARGERRERAPRPREMRSGVHGGGRSRVVRFGGSYNGSPRPGRQMTRKLDALLAAVGVLFGAASLAWPFGWDTSVHYYVGREWLLRGAIPYRDTFDHKTPGIHARARAHDRRLRRGHVGDPRGRALQRRPARMGLRLDCVRPGLAATGWATRRDDPLCERLLLRVLRLLEHRPVRAPRRDERRIHGARSSADARPQHGLALRLAFLPASPSS